MKVTSQVPQEGRFDRQLSILSERRRKRLGMVLLAADANPWCSRWLVAGASAMGIRTLAADSLGGTHQLRDSHWFLNDYVRVSETIYPAVRFDHLDPVFLPEDIEAVLTHAVEPWFVVQLNDVAQAVERLQQAELSNEPRLPILGILTSPVGVLVWGFRSPAECVAELEVLGPAPAVPPGPPEVACLGAGSALNQVMRGATSDNGGIVGFYSLPRFFRVVVDREEGLGALRRELSESGGSDALLRNASPLAGKRAIHIGCGGIGSFSGVLLAMAGADLLFADPDRYARSNLNRQVWGAAPGGLGNPKSTVMARELNTLCDRAACEALVAKIEDDGTLIDLAERYGADAIACAPDQDETRLMSGRVSAQLGLPLAVGGTSAVGGQAVNAVPGSTACYGCTVGDRGVRPEAVERNSCSATADAAVVCSNMVIGGLMVSEMKHAFTGGRPANVRFVGDADGGVTRLVRMVTPSACEHWAAGTRMGGQGQ